MISGRTCLVFTEERLVKEKSGGGLASTFPAVHAPASPLVSYAFTIHVYGIGRRVRPLVTAGAAVGRSRENTAYMTLVRALLQRIRVRVGGEVGLE